MSYFSEKDFADCMVHAVKVISTELGGNFFTGIHGVPRGGIPFATALSYKTGIPLVTHSECFKNPETTLIVDDLYDSGVTRKRYPEKSMFMTLLSKQKYLPVETFTCRYIPADDWVEFFWEVSPSENSATDIVTRMLQYIGEDINREGLKDTPKRVLKAWDHIFSGYKIDPKSLITTFESPNYDEMVLLKNIELYSMCEHHLLPFVGKAHVAYIPNGKVIGVSKLARLVDCFARRAQIQERIGEQITSFLMDELDALGAGCIIEAQHLCMKMRGVEKQHSEMITSSLKGVFKDDPSCRSEFMMLCK